MITQKLKNLLLISIPFFIVHEIEEWSVSFWNVDNFTLSVSRHFDSVPQAVFIIWNLTFLLALVVFVLLIRGGKYTLFALAVPGLIFVFELDHIIKAFLIAGYYPGLYTSFAFLVLGFLYWKEYLINLKLNFK